MVLFCHPLNQETKPYGENPLKSKDAFLDTVLQVFIFYIYVEAPCLSDVSFP